MEERDAELLAMHYGMPIYILFFLIRSVAYKQKLFDKKEVLLLTFVFVFVTCFQLVWIERCVLSKSFAQDIYYIFYLNF